MENYREYKGQLISKMGRNDWGGRWECRIEKFDGGHRISSDTLAGIKKMITEELEG